MKKHYYSNPKYVWLEKDILNSNVQVSKTIKDLYPEKDLDPQNDTPQHQGEMQHKQSQQQFQHQSQLQYPQQQDRHQLQIQKKSLMKYGEYDQGLDQGLGQGLGQELEEQIFKKIKHKTRKIIEKLEEKVAKKIEEINNIDKKTLKKEIIPFWVALIIGIQSTVIFFVTVLLAISLYFHKHK